MSARRAVLVDVVRTPFGRGRAEGVLSGVHPVDLLAGLLDALLARTGIDPGLVEDVIAGCAIPVGEQSGNVARHAVLAAGMPEHVPGTTIDRKCGSAQQAVQFAAQGIVAGAYDVVIAGGVEMMGTVPMRANRLGRDDLGPRLHGRYPEGLVRQGVSAELIAAKWGLTREQCDAWALRSHRRAAAARDSGALGAQIVPVTRDNGTVVTADEGIRDGTSTESLARLRPAFVEEEAGRRFPQIEWVLTAGSSSPVSDGASVALLMADDVAERLGLVPRAAVVAGTVVGSDPLLMLTGPIPATQKLLGRTGMAIDDVDVFEVNEAFSSVVLAWLAETGADPERVNPLGGAIAYGHPVGASGGRLVATALAALERDGGRFGLVTMCESGGMANALLLERL